MKINEIRIRRFGVWQDVTLPVHHHGLNVVYGPNEAGKSTLLRFIRGMMYGFQPDISRQYGNSERPPAGGTLHLEHEGQWLELNRSAMEGAARGRMQLRGPEGEANRETSFRQLLKQVDETLFENIFAVGLTELQELATLQSDEVAQHVYGLSLGPEGQRLVDVTRDIRRRRGAFIDQKSRRGIFPTLLAERHQLNRQLAELGDLRAFHGQLHTRLAAGEQQIDNLRRKQASLQEQLAAHEFIARIHAPWKEVQDYRHQLDGLPSLAGFPADGLERLSQIEQDLQAAEHSRAEAVREVRRLHREATGLRPTPELEERIDAVRGLVAQREWIAELIAERDAAKKTFDVARQQFDASRRQLEPEWTEERLDLLDCTPSAAAGFITTARQFQSVIGQRNRLQKKHTRLSKSCQQRSTEIADRLRELGVDSTEAAITERRAQLEELRTLASLETEEAGLAERLQADQKHLKHLDSREAVPTWVYWFLGLLIAGGCASMVVGLVTGISYNVIAGLMWAMLGATCVASAAAWRSHIETGTADTAGMLQHQIGQTELRLREVHQHQERIRQALPQQSLRPVAGRRSTESASMQTAVRIQNLSAELAAMEQLQAREQRITARRRYLTQLRGRFQAVQRELTAARQKWCEQVTRVGLPEMVRIGETVRLWRQVAGAGEALKSRKQAQGTYELLDRNVSRLTARIAELNRELPTRKSSEDPLEILEAWNREISRYSSGLSRYRQLRREVKSLRRTADNCRMEIDRLRRRQTELLALAGASSREDFELRAAGLSRRAELTELLELAEAELRRAGEGQPAVAMTEEDLQDFDPVKNAEAGELIQMELQDLDRELQAQHESLGSIRQEIRQLEQDRRQHELHTRRVLVDDRIRTATKDWAALEVASEAVEQVRAKFERTCQPKVLAAASRYLKQLTGNRYRNIWTSLGSQELKVDDDSNRTFSVVDLSNGTREQLFLAIRLALIDGLREKGIRLPMVLDDVLVNFDQTRTEAAIETLTEFAAGGQQVLLFTCHLHLAHLCEARDIQPIWLPGHQHHLEGQHAG